MVVMFNILIGFCITEIYAFVKVQHMDVIVLKFLSKEENIFNVKISVVI